MLSQIVKVDEFGIGSKIKHRYFMIVQCKQMCESHFMCSYCWSRWLFCQMYKRKRNRTTTTTTLWELVILAQLPILIKIEHRAKIVCRFVVAVNCCLFYFQFCFTDVLQMACHIPKWMDSSDYILAFLRRHFYLNRVSCLGLLLISHFRYMHIDIYLFNSPKINIDTM